MTLITIAQDLEEYKIVIGEVISAVDTGTNENKISRSFKTNTIGSNEEKNATRRKSYKLLRGLAGDFIHSFRSICLI